MKLNRYVPTLFAVSIALLLIAACAQPPKAEVDAATAAVAKAEADQDAGVYAPESLARAKEALARMQGELDAKKYDSAKALAIEATQSAEKAIADGQSGKERMKKSAEDLFPALKKAFSEAQKALDSGKKTRGVKLDFAALTLDLENAQKQIAAAEADYAAGDYKASVSKGEAARTRLADLTARVSDAVRAVSRKK